MTIKTEYTIHLNAEEIKQAIADHVDATAEIEGLTVERAHVTLHIDSNGLSVTASVHCHTEEKK